MKKSIVLLELIISLVLFSIIAIVSSKMVYSLVEKNYNDTFIVQNNLILETTRLFLSKNSDLSKIKQTDSNLYFDDNLLLENVSAFEISKIDDITTINICIFENKICQKWKMKN